MFKQITIGAFTLLLINGCTEYPDVCKGKHGYRVGLEEKDVSSDGDFVSEAYKLILQRNPVQEDYVYHCTALADGKVNRLELVGNFYASPEAKSMNSKK